MKDFAPQTLLAIAQETFGLWLYVGLLAALGLAALYGYLVVAGAPFRGAARRGALAIGFLAALVAIAVAPWITAAGHAHLIAGIDVVAMALIALGASVAGFLAAWPILAAFLGLPGERRATLTEGSTRRAG